MSYRCIMLTGVLTLLLIPFGASAQRTVSGRGMVSLSGQYPWGAALSYGRYLPSSFWETGAQGLLRRCPVVEGVEMDYGQAFAYALWMYRIAGTTDRVLSLYGGAGAWLGAEFYDPWRHLPSHITLDDGTAVHDTPASFIYGVLASLQLQIFLSRSLSILLSASAPVNFSSRVAWISPGGSLGLRLDL